MRVRFAVGALLLASAASGRLWSAGHFGFIVQLPGTGVAVRALERDAKGDLIVAGTTTVRGAAGGVSDIFVAKYSQTGERLWSTLIGGSDWEEFNALAVDPAGDLFLLGMTGSRDFPGGKPPTDRFLLKLAGDGRGPLALHTLNFVQLLGLAIDPQGRPWVAAADNFSKFVFVPKVARLDPASGEVELVAMPPVMVTRIAFDGDGTPWLLGADRLFRVAGTALTAVPISSTAGYTFLQALRAAGGRVCAAGNAFTTPIAVCVDARTSEALWTWEPPADGAPLADRATLHFDPDGGIWVGGLTDNLAFPTRATLQGAFNPMTGFLTRLGADGSLVESSFVGDWRSFEVTGVMADREHTVFAGNAPGEAFLVEVVHDETPAVRIDSVSPPIDVARQVVLLGAGFGESAAVTFDGEPGTVLEQSPDRLLVLTPDHPFPAGFTIVQVESGGVRSNTVLLSTVR